jgi:hypothetical protein
MTSFVLGCLVKSWTFHRKADHRTRTVELDIQVMDITASSCVVTRVPYQT